MTDLERAEQFSNLDHMFRESGYVVIKNLINPQTAQNAATWLRTQDVQQFEMTDSEPGNCFSRLLNGHTLKDTPFHALS